MPYLNLDDNFADHPKVDRLSDGAFRLHTAALCHCAKHRTDGFVDETKVPRLVPRYKPAYLAELLHNHDERPSWVPAPGGYQIHDYLKWNRSKTEIEERKETNAKRQAKWREAHRDEDGQFIE